MPRRLFSETKDARGPAPRRNKATAASGASSGIVTSPMQATVVKCEVEPGQRVVAGDLLLVLEAMKMEQPIQSAVTGTVEEVAAPVGGTVSSGHTLLRIAPDAA